MKFLENFFLLPSISVIFVATAAASPLTFETIISEIEVDAHGDNSVFANPFDYRNGNIFTVHVETGTTQNDDGMNLATVVRHGTRLGNGQWKWQKKIIETRTIRDSWHTQASIALDKSGYLHVAYNMHNLPWQYSISAMPTNIEHFKFQGQPITEEEIRALVMENKALFPQIGSAAIPGNQVTYPMFFQSPARDLYITYRYAVKPARKWERRAFAGAIAKYDVDNRKWIAIGGPVEITENDARIPAGTTAVQYPFALEDTYSVYLIQLAFDNREGIHAFWNWRPEGAGERVLGASYAASVDGKTFVRSDGSTYKLPISYSDSEFVSTLSSAQDYYAAKSAAVLSNGEPAVVVHSRTKGRQLVSFNNAVGQWRLPEPMPAGASEIIVDKQGQIWAFASGLRVYKRAGDHKVWQQVLTIGNNLCSPRAKYFHEEDRFIVQGKTCDGKRASIFSFASK